MTDDTATPPPLPEIGHIANSTADSHPQFRHNFMISALRRTTGR
jgi:hypothetical protein